MQCDFYDSYFDFLLRIARAFSLSGKGVATAKYVLKSLLSRKKQTLFRAVKSFVVDTPVKVVRKGVTVALSIAFGLERTMLVLSKPESICTDQG